MQFLFFKNGKTVNSPNQPTNQLLLSAYWILRTVVWLSGHKAIMVFTAIMEISMY